MSKYLTAYQNALSTFFQYRLNLGLLLISHFVSLSGLIYLWLAIYNSGQKVGAYTLSQIILYYLLLTVLRLTIADGVGMGFQVSDEIKDGLITSYLLKPFSYPLEQLLKLLAQATVNALFVIPILVLLGFIFKSLIALPSFHNILAFLASSLVGLLFYYLIYFLSALSAFWIYKARSVIYGVIIVSSLMNGSMLPLDLFPDWLQTASLYLPFQYLMFVPIQAYLGRVNNWGQIIMLTLLWIVILAIAITGAWRMGIKKFEAVGQ